jgi:uncharacterized membrane protein
MRYIGTIFLLGCILVPSDIFAQELYQDLQGVWRARVIEVMETRTEIVPGTNVENSVQTLQVELLEGEREGEIVVFENDYIQLEKDDTFYLNYLVPITGGEIYSVREIDRRASMGLLVVLFVAVILVFGGKQGLRSLLSLAGSLLVIVYLLVPALVEGYSPVPVSIGVAAAVLFFAIFFTHGFNKRSLIAFVGTIVAVGITGLLAYVSIEGTGLTGLGSDESVYLNLGTGGQLDFVGLLLAAVIIGALGVLDDIAITQVAVVRELFGAGNHLTKWDVYRKAMRVGREHVSALVNTLVLAYTGAALPLLLLFSLSDSGWLTIVNREIFATEIVRALIGSIGLVLTVPITTLLAVIVLEKYRGQISKEETHGHHHAH